MKALIAFALVLVAGPVLAQVPAGEPIVQTSLDPAEGIVIGQPVRVNVRVMFPGDMPHPPRVSLAEAAGAQILRFETQATTTQDQIAGQDYVGQNFEFVLFPRRGGEIAVPAPKATLLDRSGDPAGTVSGEAMRISVSVPPGIDPSGPVLVAERVEAEQSWSPDPGLTQFKAGSALVRTIRRQADGVPALGMAEFRFTAPEGVRVYVDPPGVDDRVNRGSVVGHRTDKVTYVFERAGSYELPALSQPWWSLASKQARTETLPGVAVTIQAGATNELPDARSRLLLQPVWLAVAAAALVLACALVLFRRRLAALWNQVALRRRSSEAAARRELVRAARAGDASATYQALRRWLHRLPLDEQRRARSSPALASAILRLEHSLFGTGSGWAPETGAALAGTVGDLHRLSRSRPSGTPGPLPPLNPVPEARSVL